MRIILFAMLTGCFLDFKETPGINTARLSERNVKITWSKMASPHKALIDSLSYYHFYEIVVYDVKNEMNHTEVTTDLHLGQFFSQIDDTVFIDKNGITEFLAPDIVPLQLIIVHQYREGK